MSFAFSKNVRRACLPLALTLALSACSGDLVPPEDVDDNTTVSAITPRHKVEDTNYAAPSDPTSRAAESADYLNTPNLAGQGRRPHQQADTADNVDPSNTIDASNDDSQPDAVAPKKRLPKIDEDPQPGMEALASPDQLDNADQQVAKQSQIPDDGVNMDSTLGVEDPTSLAQEENIDIAEGNTDEPVVDGIGTDTPVEVQHKSKPAEKAVPFDQASTADEITLPEKRRQPQNETKVAFLPRFDDPSEVPESYGGLTAADRACRSDLERMGVRYRELPPIYQGPTCGIPHPIEVSGFAGGIRLYPAAKLNCSMTRVFAKFVKNELVPEARYRYFSGIKTIHQLSSYSCRRMDSLSRNPWSEHAKGNALDVGGFILNSGKEIDVAKKGFFEFREKGLLNTVRADSCKYFNTVLGPGDAYHGNHFHFDLRYRKSGRRYCSL